VFPVLADLYHNGLQHLVVGYSDGTILFYENQLPFSRAYVEIDDSYSPLYGLVSPCTTSMAIPTIADINNGKERGGGLDYDDDDGGHYDDDDDG